jgi:hypothetical protein
VTVPAPPLPTEWAVPPELTILDLPGIGPVIGAHECCVAVEKTLLTWLPSFTAALTAAGGISLGPILRAEQLPDAASAATWGTPALFVSSPGLVGKPQIYRDAYTATWQVDVTIGDRGDSWRDTQERVRRWLALAIRTLVLNPALGDLGASGVTWDLEGYARGPANAGRTLGLGALSVLVTVSSVIDLAARPELPADPGDAPGEAPTATELDLSYARLDTEDT